MQTFEYSNKNPSLIELPPTPAVSSSTWLRVVIIVPAFAERDEREDQGVSGLVTSGLEALGAPDVRERVDASGAMEEHDRRDDAPNQHLRAIHVVALGAQPSAGTGHCDAGQKRNEDIEAVEEDQLGVFR